MRFCSIYSDSHRCFLDSFFLKTFPFESGVSLILERMPQKCSAGSLFSHGWRDQMIEKQLFINKNLQTFFLEEALVFSDIDISFYGDVKEDLLKCLGNNDIAFMKDHNNSEDYGRCGGFFVVRSNPKTRELFSKVLNKLNSFSETKNVDFNTSEQHAINSELKALPEVKWTYLPPRYYTHGLYIEGLETFSENNQSGLWWNNKNEREKNNVFIPKDIKVHHANWAIGIKPKMELLEFISNKIKERRDDK